MKLGDFVVGERFWSGTGCEYVCTDIGSRCIVAIEVDSNLDEEWFAGPPYLLPEIVFDQSEVEEFRVRLSPPDKQAKEAA